MHENGAAQALNPRNLVVTEHNNDIVKTILAPQALGSRRIGVSYRAIVISIAHGIAPTVARSQWQDWAAGSRS
jgi:hypothetical protein